MERTASTLKKGEKAVIKNLTDGPESQKLMELGCLPGEEIRIKYKAPLGDPLCFDVSGYNLALRQREAEQIVIY